MRKESFIYRKKAALRGGLFLCPKLTFPMLKRNHPVCAFLEFSVAFADGGSFTPGIRNSWENDSQEEYVNTQKRRALLQLSAKRPQLEVRNHLDRSQYGLW